MLHPRLASLIVVLASSLLPATAAQATTSHHGFAVPRQWRTPGGRYPDRTDPTRRLPWADQLAFACIRFHESRNHLQDGLGSQGWYQFTLATWGAARQFIVGLPPTPNQASGDQQSAVAVWYFLRNGRFGVQWAADASSCPGVFYFG